MLAFASRPYDLAALRAILGWLERYVAVYVQRLEELRAEIATRLHELGAARYQEALRACHDAVTAERALTPRALRAHAVIPPAERIAAQAGFFAAGGGLAAACARIDDATRGVVVKMQHHVRELERRNARLGDLRAAIRAVAGGPAEDARLGALVGALVASGHVRLDRRPATASARMTPPMPRSHTRAAAAPEAQPLARKRGTLAAARALAAQRQAELGMWLGALVGDDARRRLSTAAVGADGPRRWLDVARAAHLGGGRALHALGFALAPAGGEAVLGDDTCGLRAPDQWIQRRRS